MNLIDIFSSVSPQSFRIQESKLKTMFHILWEKLVASVLKLMRAAAQAASSNFSRESEHPVQRAKGENAFGVNGNALNF